MNRTKIEYVDFSWSPLTGCYGPGGTQEHLKHCPYCYAQRFAERGLGKYGQYAREQRFNPRFYDERLAEPTKIKKPSRIFVCSMGDLLGEWVDSKLIEQVINITRLAPQHTYLFLTKNPQRYSDFSFPDNCWLGTTITGQWNEETEFGWRRQKLSNKGKNHLFISFEPLMEDYAPYLGICLEQISLFIIGAMTGPEAKYHQPKKEWVENLITQADEFRIPVFLKNNLLEIYPGLPRRQELP